MVLLLLEGVTSTQLPETYPDAPPKYDFNYGVRDDNTANSFGLQESRDGARTSGQYHVALPDGRVQVVTYTADENGYKAQVDYQGEAAFPVPPQSSTFPARYISFPLPPPPPTPPVPQFTSTSQPPYKPAPVVAPPANYAPNYPYPYYPQT
nr:cuticle protein 19-like [Cherax quadricarinatus]